MSRFKTMARQDEVRKTDGHITGLENEDQKWGSQDRFGEKSGEKVPKT